MTEPTVFRANAISYLRIPASDPDRAAAFYAAAFGWETRKHGSTPAFTDGSGHVIGHFVSDQAVAGGDGVRPYIYVDSVARALEAIVAAGGMAAREPYLEGNLTVATFHDSEGNEVGVWQTGALRAPAG